MVGLPSPIRGWTRALSTRSTPAAPAVLAMTLILAAVFAGTIGRHVPRRERALLRRKSDTSDQTALDMAAAIGNAGESARVALHTLALQAQALTGSELAAAGIGDGTNPFQVWAHLGMPPEQVRQ